MRLGGWFSACVLVVACSTADPELRADADPTLPGVEDPDPRLDHALAAALAKLGPGHEVRTRHTIQGKPAFTNRLILEDSPYLQLQAHSPINWFTWGEEAMLRAEVMQRPVLVSVGYAACHWCQVMARESFEDPEIAEYINETFVAVKVDRETRPDLDDLYMSAVHAMRDRGGWPMTLVMTPQGEPFFGSGYLPPRDGQRGRNKGLLTLLQELAEVYASDPEAVTRRTAEVMARVPDGSAIGTDIEQLPSLDLVVNQVRALAVRFDDTWGGFGAAPKFPRPGQLRLLLRYHRRTRDPAALRMVTRTLEGLEAGGLHDHVGGGFHRYSTDERWHVPLYEKMLYDNAQLTLAATEAWQSTRRTDFARMVRSTLTFLLRDLRNEGGGFSAAISASSADAKGALREGLFYTWTWPELVAALGKEDAVLWSRAYGVRGDAEGRTTLMRQAFHPIDKPDKASRELGARLERLRARLFEVRERRPAPSVDTLAIAAWNGLAISAFATAGSAFDEGAWVGAAEEAAEFVLRELVGKDGRLRRSWIGGEASGMAIADDYAFMVAGLLDLFEVTGTPRWLIEARRLQDLLDTHYGDPRGGWFLTASDAEPLLRRLKTHTDGSEPAASSIAARSALRLARWTADDRYRRTAVRALAAFGPRMSAAPVALPEMAMALDLAHDRLLEVVVVHPGSGGGELERLLQERFEPSVVSVVLSESEVEQVAGVAPVVLGKAARGGVATAWVCELGACRSPVTTASELARQLAQVKPLLGDRVPGRIGLSQAAAQNAGGKKETEPLLP